MKKVIKFLFGILFIFCSCVFTSIYIMSGSVAENYKVNRGEELQMDTFMPVTAVYNGVKMSQGVYARQIGESFEVDLKIFGVIPFSTVNVEIVAVTKNGNNVVIMVLSNVAVPAAE